MRPILAVGLVLLAAACSEPAVEPPAPAEPATPAILRNLLRRHAALLRHQYHAVLRRTRLGDGALADDLGGIRRLVAGFEGFEDHAFLSEDGAPA